MHSTIAGGAVVLLKSNRDMVEFGCPRVSVIIPCYNLGDYLRETIESVQAQTLRDYEIIVVDDGSTEVATQSVLAGLEREGVVVVRTPNRGLASARNEGISRARGEYLLPLDSDDRIAPRYLELAVTALDADPEVGVVYGSVELFGEARGVWQQPDFSANLILFENMIVATAVFRRCDWVQVGGYRVNMIHGWEDWDFWLSLVEIGRKVVRLPEVVFYYRIRHGSMSARMNRWQKLRMYLNLLCQHKKLYLRNFNLLLERCLSPGHRRISSPRD